MMHHRGTIQVNVPIAIIPRLDGEVIPLTIQDSQIVVPVTPAMHLQTTITGSAHNVTPPVVGREEDLTILVKLIAFHATLEMRLPDIIQVNVRIAIRQMLIGEMQSFPTQAIQIVYPVIQVMLQTTIIQASVQIATIQTVDGLTRISTIMG
jgi:hypothetical protein